MVLRKLPDDLFDPRPLLDALRDCRQSTTDAMSQVKPFGQSYRILAADGDD